MKAILTIEEYKKNFLSKINKDENDCWIWNAALDKMTKYGINKDFKSRKCLRSHRISYILHKGNIPKGMFVCHTCDVKLCINPDHLYLGTHKDNMRDQKERKRAHRPSSEDCVFGKFNKDIVLEIRDIYKQNKMTISQLSTKYNVYYSSIYNIIKRKSWNRI